MNGSASPVRCGSSTRITPLRESPAVWSIAFRAGSHPKMFRYRASLILALTLSSAAYGFAGPRPQLSEAGREGVRLVHRGRWERAAEAFRRAVDAGHPSPAELAGLGYTSMKVKR